MIIRKAIPNDFPRLIELSRGFTMSPYAFDKRLAKICPNIYPAFASDMIHNVNSISIVAEDTNIKGYITVSINNALSSAAGKKIGSILLLAVEPVSRSKGIGKILAQKGVALLLTMGAEIITVGTDIYNYSAIHIYESCNFKFKMGWHIFRYFPEFGINKKHVLDNIDVYHTQSLDEFCKNFSRPVSLLKEKNIETGRLKEYLTENFKKSIINGTTTALQYFNRNKPVGMITIAKDEIGQKTLQTNKSVYKILDLIVLNDSSGENTEKKLLQDITSRIFDYCLMEFWVDAENASLIQTLESSGFRLSYTGLSYHLVRK